MKKTVEFKVTCTIECEDAALNIIADQMAEEIEEALCFAKPTLPIVDEPRSIEWSVVEVSK